jgi:nucleotide-binding universal stress UspA family protein
MALKDILVCLDPTDAGDVRLRLAAALAREHRAHVSAAYILQQDIAGAPPYGGIGIRAPSGAAGIAPGSIVAGVPAPAVRPATLGEAAGGGDLADIIEQRFRATVQPQATAGEWYLFGEGGSEELIRLLRAFDLVVYGQSSPDYRMPTGFQPEDIIMACGRPVLVVPDAGEFAMAGRRVLLAWDGTREAARAVNDAVPLIGQAEAVTVVTVRANEADFEHNRPQLERMVRHLERHGIAARPEEAAQGDLRVSDVLLSLAADLGADMIVTGAYHHSQIRETLFGGVSRELLDHMTVPVLMSH